VPAEYFEKQRWNYAIIKQPKQIGAAIPSSKKLGRAMAEQIPMHEDALIIELGAGTGAITQQIKAKIHKPENFLVIERSKGLADYLKKQFSDLNVIHGDAAELEKIIAPYNKKVCAIVSSLPLRSLNKAVVRKIEDAANKVLEKDGVFIQFTYDLRPSSIKQLPDFRWRNSTFVFQNIPPARVNVYTSAKE